MLHAATNPKRARPGIAERDRLVLLTLAMTGLRRSELIALDWSDVTLDEGRPSLLVRRGKGGKPRRQPLPAELAAALERSRTTRDPAACDPAACDPVFCGLAGGRLQPTILAGAHPPRQRRGRALQARDRAHAAPHRRDLAATGDRRHAPGGRVPRPRRPLDSCPLCARDERGAARRGAEHRRGPRREAPVSVSPSRARFVRARRARPSGSALLGVSGAAVREAC
jgi:hypothetical protein